MEPIGAEVRRELGRFGTSGEMADLVTAWPEAVGETVAANAWPARSWMLSNSSPPSKESWLIQAGQLRCVLTGASRKYRP